jgi:rubrerythrin
MSANSSKVSLDLVKVLEICRDVELTNAALYHYFAEIFSSDPEVAALWRKTAGEEENHAKQFVLGIKMRKEKIVDSLSIDGTKAKEMLDFVRVLSAEVRTSPPDKVEALRIAIDLEEKLTGFHMTTVSDFTDSNLKKLFTAMMKTDDHHVEKLHVMHRRLLSL